MKMKKRFKDLKVGTVVQFNGKMCVKTHPLVLSEIDGEDCSVIYPFDLVEVTAVPHKVVTKSHQPASAGGIDYGKLAVVCTRNSARTVAFNKQHTSLLIVEIGNV